MKLKRLILATPSLVQAFALPSFAQQGVERTEQPPTAKEPNTEQPDSVADAADPAQDADLDAEVDFTGKAVLTPVRQSGFRRPYGVAEFGVGVLTLPDAEVCVERTEAGCRNGDSSVEISAWPLFRASESVAVGAGLTLALLPTADAPRNDPPNIPRDHTRGYFLAEAVGRYYPWVTPNFEGWVGLTTGLVVLSDTFTNQNDQPKQVAVGGNGVTIRTEGFTLGVAGGVAWPISRHFLLGGTLRLANWLLPGNPARIAIGDEASLTGRVTMFDVSFVVSYRPRF